MKAQIYDMLMADKAIQSLVEDRIKLHEYPPTENMEGVYIVIDPLDVPRPSEHADDEPRASRYLFQIEVWSQEMDHTDLVAKRVAELMRSLNFGQGPGIDEWDSELNIFRDARQYHGQFYN